MAGKTQASKKQPPSSAKKTAKQQPAEPLILDPSNPVLPESQDGTSNTESSGTTVESKRLSMNYITFRKGGGI